MRRLEAYCSYCYHDTTMGWQLVNRFCLDSALGLQEFSLASFSAWIEETDVVADSDVQWQVRVHLWNNVGVATHDETLTIAALAAGGTATVGLHVDVSLYNRMDVQIQAATGAMKPPRFVNIGVEIKEIVYA
jgi:hypothetical protein